MPKITPTTAGVVLDAAKAGWRKVAELLGGTTAERMARAAEQNFAPGYYHASDVVFDGTPNAVEAKMYGIDTQSEFKPKSGGTYFSRDSDVEQMFGGDTFGTKASEFYIRTGNNFDATKYASLGDSDKAVLHKAITDAIDADDIADAAASFEVSPDDIDPVRSFIDGEFYFAFGRSRQDHVLNNLRAAGFDSVTFPDQQVLGSPHTSTVVFDPKNIRSPEADFNPANKDSANLLAGIGSLAAPLLKTAATGAALYTGAAALAPQNAEAGPLDSMQENPPASIAPRQRPGYFDFANQYGRDTAAMGKGRTNLDGSYTSILMGGVEHEGKLYGVPFYDRDTGRNLTEDQALKKFMPYILNGEIPGIGGPDASQTHNELANQNHQQVEADYRNIDKNTATGYREQPGGLLLDLSQLTDAHNAVNHFAERRASKQDYWKQKRQEVLDMANSFADTAFRALDMPLQGYMGLAGVAGTLAAGGGFDNAIQQGAINASRPTDETAYQWGGAVTDTLSPYLPAPVAAGAGALINAGVLMGSPL